MALCAIRIECRVELFRHIAGILIIHQNVLKQICFQEMTNLLSISCIVKFQATG